MIRNLKNISFALLLILSSITSLKGQSLDVQFDYCQFTSSDNLCFVETYLSVDGNSTKFKKTENGNLQSKIEVEFIFSDSNNEIKKVDKYNLLSPLVEDTTNIDFIFLDLQRYTLLVGDYNLKIKIKDLNNPSDNFIDHQQSVKIIEQKGLSDLQLVNSYSPTNTTNILSKNGFDLTPFVSNFYNSSNHELNYYFEYYNTNEKVILRTSIISNESKEAVFDLIQTKWSKNERTIVLSSFPIKELPSNTYSLLVEVINENNEVIESKERVIFKQGYKTELENLSIEKTFASRISNIDTLKKYIQYLYPIENSNESIYSSNQLSYNDLELMQKYFYQFWKTRNVFNPELAWLEYLQKVKKANKEFNNGFIEGFLSDRGRIFLSHGYPSSRVQEYHPQQFKPFEVWHYYKIESERDVRFIFSEVNPNQFRLVYSNKEGEVSDQDWSNKFNSNYYENNNDNNSPWDYFNNPK